LLLKVMVILINNDILVMIYNLNIPFVFYLVLERGYSVKVRSTH